MFLFVFEAIHFVSLKRVALEYATLKSVRSFWSELGTSFKRETGKRRTFIEGLFCVRFYTKDFPHRVKFYSHKNTKHSICPAWPIHGILVLAPEHLLMLVARWLPGPHFLLFFEAILQVSPL